MGCKVESKDGITSITCNRGEGSKAKTVVVDKQRNEWLCDYDKDQLEIFPDNRGVEVYNKEGTQRKIMRGYLKLKQVLQEE